MDNLVLKIVRALKITFFLLVLSIPLLLNDHQANNAQVEMIETSTTTITTTSKHITYDLKLIKDVSISSEDSQEHLIEFESIKGDEIKIEFKSNLNKPVRFKVNDPNGTTLMHDRGNNIVSFFSFIETGIYTIHLSEIVGEGEMTLKIYNIENKRTSTHTLTTKVTVKIRTTKDDTSSLETSMIASPTPVEVNEKDTYSTLFYYPLLIIIIIIFLIIYRHYHHNKNIKKTP